MNLYELYEIADENAINVDYFPMRQAVSISIPDSIAIDIDKIETCREEKAVLAHELGHCMTGSFYTISTIDNRGENGRKGEPVGNKNTASLFETERGSCERHLRNLRLSRLLRTSRIVYKNSLKLLFKLLRINIQS